MHLEYAAHPTRFFSESDRDLWETACRGATVSLRRTALRHMTSGWAPIVDKVPARKKPVASAARKPLTLPVSAQASGLDA